MQSFYAEFVRTVFHWMWYSKRRLFEWRDFIDISSAKAESRKQLCDQSKSLINQCVAPLCDTTCWISHSVTFHINDRTIRLYPIRRKVQSRNTRAQSQLLFGPRTFDASLTANDRCLPMRHFNLHLSISFFVSSRMLCRLFRFHVQCTCFPSSVCKRCELCTVDFSPFANGRWARISRNREHYKHCLCARCGQLVKYVSTSCLCVIVQWASPNSR